MPRQTKKRSNGEGSYYQRKDGRFVASLYVDIPGEGRKRITTYSRTARDAKAKMKLRLLDIQEGRPHRIRDWTVKQFLEHWLANVVAIKNRPRTYESYESIVRRHLIPGFGHFRLADLSVYDVQVYINKLVRSGVSARSVGQVRSVLRTALSRAEREELVTRNVAKLVDVPGWQRKMIVPWSPSDVTRFLKAAESHVWYLAYALLLLFGMRRGEVLGLRWCDVDFENRVIHVRQQLQRIGGKLVQAPVKTLAGVRDLPLVPFLEDRLRLKHLELLDPRHHHTTNELDSIDSRLVFTSGVGTPVDPKNFVRAFHILRERAGLARITVHHARHTAATMLKDVGMPVRDAQLILGHSHVTTTMQLYQHGTSERQREAIEKITKLVI